MNILKKIQKLKLVITDPQEAKRIILIKKIKMLGKLSPYIGDRLYLKLYFPLKNGYELNLKNPKTYNEKLQWLKLNYRNPLLTTLADKYEVKQYVANKIGEEYVIKNYGVWNSFEEIDFDKLPNKFVLKTTHDAGGVVICKDMTSFDFQAAKKEINKHLATDYFLKYREWPYKNIKPRILAEKYLVNESMTGLRDYKFYCFYGKPKVILIVSGRESGNPTYSNYDVSFDFLNFTRGEKPNGSTFKKPKNFEKMLKIAENISQGLPHVRVDLYNVEGKILLGELTFFSGGGFVPFHPEKWDYKFGSWLDLSNNMDY